MKKTPLILIFIFTIFCWGLNFHEAIASYTSIHHKIKTDTTTVNFGNPIFDLKEGETLSLLVQSNGCYTAHSKLLLITKEKELFITRLYFNPTIKSQTNAIRMPFDPNNGDLMETHALSNKEMDYFMSFLISLNSIRDKGCSTTDTYVLNSIRFSMIKVDGTCQWKGFDRLQKELFNQ